MEWVRRALEEDGYAIAPGADRDTVARLIEAVEEMDEAGVEKRRRGGVRNLLRVPEVAEWACSSSVARWVRPILGEGFFAVRGILFDKTPQANWKVAWHQDLTIAVKQRQKVEGFAGWSEKSEVVHVLAPAEVLARMLTVRLHLDDCGKENGPLRVIPGSHAEGKLDDRAVEAFRTRGREVVCAAQAGSVLLMRPLLLHASSAATTPARRRVIHIEFAVDRLPGGLEWAGH